MGWLYCAKTRAELVAKLRNDGPVVASRQRGNHLWQVYECPDGTREIVLFLLGVNNGLHGYKDIGESCGPGYYDCPISLMEMAQPAPSSQWAVEWREKVRRHHEQQTASKVGKVAGAIVLYGGRKYKLIENLGRRGWQVYCLDDGRTYRMKATQAKHAELVLINAESVA